MRKISLLMAALAVFLFLTGCGGKEEAPEASFTGTIVEVNGEMAIVEADEGEDIRSSGDLVEVNLSVNKNVSFMAGDRVKVVHEGPVQEKYPLGISTVSVELLVRKE